MFSARSVAIDTAEIALIRAGPSGNQLKERVSLPASAVLRLEGHPETNLRQSVGDPWRLTTKPSTSKDLNSFIYGIS